MFLFTHLVYIQGGYSLLLSWVECGMFDVPQLVKQIYIWEYFVRIRVITVKKVTNNSFRFDLWEICLILHNSIDKIIKRLLEIFIVSAARKLLADIFIFFGGGAFFNIFLTGAGARVYELVVHFMNLFVKS